MVEKEAFGINTNKVICEITNDGDEVQNDGGNELYNGGEEGAGDEGEERGGIKMAALLSGKTSKSKVMLLFNLRKPTTTFRQEKVEVIEKQVK